ncbi:MAG: hypothetical protein ACP5LW_01005 [Nitrososphaeria archaeon]
MRSGIRAVIFGVGNVARYLVKGIYEGVEPWHRVVGGYSLNDIRIVGAFDVDSSKVGRTLREIYGAGPEVQVLPSVYYPDEVSREVIGRIELVKASEDELRRSLSSMDADVVLNLINSGQQRASELFARASAELGYSFINATPSPIVQRRELVELFERKGAIAAGDDLQSQLGGTWLHRILMHAFRQFGSSWVKSYQLDVGGSFETLNTMDERIREEKRRIKSSAIRKEDEASEVVTGTTDYVPFLEDYRVSYFYVEVLGPFNEKFYIDAEYRTRDGPNAYNVLVDVIRAVQYERERGRSGTVREINSFGFKSNAGSINLLKILEDFEKNYVG